MDQELSEGFFAPPYLTWQTAYLQDSCVTVVLSRSQKDLLTEVLCETQTFITLPKGKHFYFKSLKEKEKDLYVAQLKGLSLRQAHEQRNFSLASYPWVYTNNFIFSLSKDYEKMVFSQRINATCFSFWDGYKQQTISLNYLGKDQSFSLWQAKSKDMLRLCLGSFYTMKTAFGEAKILLLSGHLSEFKSKRKSLGLFLQASKNITSFLHFRLNLTSLICPPIFQKYLSQEKIVSLGGNVFVHCDSYERLKKKLIALTKKFGGLEEKQLIYKCGEDPALTKNFLKHLRILGLIEKGEGYYWYSKNITEYLSPLARLLLQKLGEKAWQGLNLTDLSSSGERETLKALKRVGLVGFYEEENFYFSWQALDSFHKELRNKKPFLEAELGEIKAILAVSRKIAISFCEALREKGIMKRENNLWTWVHT